MYIGTSWVKGLAQPAMIIVLNLTVPRYHALLYHTIVQYNASVKGKLR